MPFDSTPKEEVIVYTGVAKVLDDALKLLGPNGKHWVNRCPDSGHGEYCVATAIGSALNPVSAARAYNLFCTINSIDNRFLPQWNDRLPCRGAGGFKIVLDALIKARDEAHAAGI